MENNAILRCVCFLVLVSCVCRLSDAVQCSQCNMRHRGIANTCLEPKNMSGCVGCMKTVTKVKLRDSGYMTGWERMSVVVSRYCMRNGSSNRRPTGCYKQQNNGGYTERCFCYSDHCNSGAPSSIHRLMSSFLSSSSPLPICIITILVMFFNNTWSVGCVAAIVDM